MRKFLTTALAVALTWAAASAVPAKPGLKKTVTQSDGTIVTVSMVGDEWHHSWVTSDGLPCVQNAAGDMVYRTANGASTVIAHEKNARTLSEQSFLSINASQMTVESITARIPRYQARAENTARNMRDRMRRTGMGGPRRAAGDPNVPQKGTPKIPILLVQYSDVKFVNSKTTFENQYTSTTSKSAYKYFYDMSGGQYAPQYDVYGPYTLSGTRATYGGNDSNGDDVGVANMVGSAIDLAGSEINWSNYDNDSDGEVDVCIVVYAGGGEAQTSIDEQIWPCQWSLASGKYYGDGSGTRTRNGKTIDKFAVFNELNGTSSSAIDGVGTFCHEYGHCMGLPDFYETTYKNGYYGMGNWDIMCGGSYNDDGYTPIGYNAYEKEFMGWYTPVTPVENTQYTLPKWNAGNDVAVKVTSPLNSNECYYLENRVKQGWDAYITDEGMLVTHLTYDASRWTANTPNNQAIQLFTIIPADNTLTEKSESKDCFGETNHALTDSSTPAAKLNMTSSGSLTGSAGYMQQPLTEIYINSSDKSVSFWYMKGNTTPLGTPTLNAAASITTDGWRASWSAVSNAGSYELQIDPVGSGSGGTGGGGSSTTPILSESFNKATTVASDDGSDISSTLDNYTNVSGWSGTKVFQAANDGVKLGSSSAAGTLTTPSLDLSASGGKVTVKLNAKQYNSSNNTLKLQCGSSTAVTKTLTDNATNYIVVLTCSAATNQKITFTGSKRAYIYNVEVYSGDVSSSLSAPRRAAAESKTITGITGTSYTVTGLKDNTTYNFKVRAIPATGDSEHSEGAWSDVKSATTLYDASQHTPFITADESLALQAYVGKSATGTIDVLYEDLTADITATITGDNAFTCPGTITRDSSGEAVLTVTYSPTAAGNHTATLTLSSTTASATVELSGTATLEPIVTSTPVLNEASSLSTSGFTASWTDETDDEAVESYTLHVNKKTTSTSSTFTKVSDASTLSDGDEVIIVYESANVAAGAFGSNSFMGTETVTISNGTITPSSDVNVFTLEASGSNWLLKTSIENGYLTTDTAKKMRTSSTGTAASISITGGNVSINFGSTLGTIMYNTGSPRFLNYASSGNTLKTPQLYKKTGSNSAPRRAIASEGDADNGGLTITGITSKSYEVTGLTAGETYDFKVKAIYTSRGDKTESTWSATRTVTLPESTDPRFTFTTTALAFASDNNSSDTKTLNLIGEYLTAGIELNISGTDAALFSVSPTSITPTSGNVNTTVTVTYTPTTAGIHSATLTVSSTGAESKTIALTGTATLFKGALTLNDATAVTKNSFTASWEDATLPAANVASYTLYVTQRSAEPSGYVYTLVTDASTLAAGDELIITNGTSETVNVASKSVSSSRISPVSSTVSNGTISTLHSDAEVFTLGGSVGNWYFAANSSTNSGKYLSTSTTSQALLYGTSSTINTALASIDIANTNIATITFKAGYVKNSNTYNTIEYYSNTFTAYTVNTANVYLFRKTPVYDNVTEVQTITGITGKTQTVTGLNPATTYFYQVKAVYSDGSESAFTDAKSVTTEDTDDPRITVSETALAFTSDNNHSATQSFTVTGKNLTDDVEFTLSGDNAGLFSVSPASVTPTDGNANATITVTYTPTTAGSHSATLTVSSADAESKTIALTGTATLFKGILTLNDATSVGSTRFTATWDDTTMPVANVKSYTLWVNKTSDGGSGGNTDNYELLLEQTTMGSTTWTKGGSTTAEDGYLRLGSSSKTGSVTSPSFDLTDYNGKVTVVVVAKRFGSDSNVQMKITVGSATKTFTGITTETTYVAVLDATADNNTVKIENLASSQRPMLKSVMIYGGDASSLYPTATTGAPRRAVATSGDAGNGGLTVTGITDKSYMVTGLTPLATYEFKVKAVYADDSESEWTEVKSVTLEDTDEARLSVSPTSLTFDAMYVGATAATKTFTVTAANLTEDVTVAVSGDGYSVSPATLTADDANGATVTVTYNPSAAGSHTGTVTLSSNEFDAVTVSLSGSASYQHFAPVMQANTTKGATSFLAEWTDETASAAVTSYTLYVNRKPDAPAYTLLLSEDLSGGTISDKWDATNTYSESDSYRIGTKNAGSITTKSPIDLTPYNGKATVVVVAKQYSTDDDVKMKITVGSATKTFTGITTEKTYVAVLDATVGSNTIKIENLAGKQRLLITSIDVYGGDASSLYPTATTSAPRRVATDGDADNGGLTITGITEKSYTVTGLTPGATYEYYVKANYSDDTVSEASNHEEVTLPDGTKLAEVLKSESGSYTVSDDMVIVAAIPASHMYYATNGTDWLPIESETTLTVGQKIHNVGGTFNGSSTAPLMELTTSDASDATIKYNIATYYLGNDFKNVPQTWVEMPVAGQVIDVVGYLFNRNGTPTLHAYSGGNAGRSMALKTDFVGLNSYDDGQYMKLRVCVELKQAWSSGARRRISAADSDAYTNLIGQVIEVGDVYTGIDDLDAGREPVKRQYVNAAGAVSDQPYDGFNIVVTTWSDGTTTAVKVAH